MNNPTVTIPPVGDRVFELRSERGWSQDELALRAGVCRATVTRIENRKQQPSMPVICSLALVFGVHPGELIGGQP